MPLSLILRFVPGVMILALVAAFLRANDKAHDWKVQAEHCAEGRKADRASYEAAQRQAADQNRAEVARKEAEQKAINNEQVSNLNARLELLRRELRAQGNPAASGSAGQSAAPESGGGPTAPGEARMCIAASDYVRAAENEERHDQLITTVERLMELLNK